MLNPITGLGLGALSGYLANRLKTQASPNVSGSITPSVVSSSGVSPLSSDPYVISGSGQVSPLTQNPAVKSATGTTQWYSAPQASQYPASPTLDYSTPFVEEMSWKEAQQRAADMYDPQYQLSRQRTEKMYSDQRQLLPQMLAARGYLKGGKREAGEQGITQNQAMTMQDLENQYNTQKQQAAYSILEGAQGRAQRQLENLIAQQQAKNAAAMQQWQTKYGAATQKESQKSAQENNLLQYLVGLFLNSD